MRLWLKPRMGRDGIERTSYIVKEPTINDRGLWEGGLCVDVELDYKREKSTLITFSYGNGAPSNIQVFKKVKDEILGQQEIIEMCKELEI